ncbi:unnamed protein product [Protopolystoma xenopodis]|uniref:Uncharacterized protein n=1 Tax=Protopolystoma xenopodis TaxID=117903 RepID=A0A3S5CUR8_9PLAT|nr:unnamed protein product [Protopolystoma xenopodis]
MTQGLFGPANLRAQHQLLLLEQLAARSTASALPTDEAVALVDGDAVLMTRCVAHQLELPLRCELAFIDYEVICLLYYNWQLFIPK